MPFGKYKGKLLSDIPEDYLRWLLDRDLFGPLLGDIEDELERRTYERDQQRYWYEQRQKQPPPPPPPTPPPSASRVDPDMVKRLIQVGFKRLALELHPDRGGDTATMQSLVNARDWLTSCADGMH